MSKRRPQYTYDYFHISEFGNTEKIVQVPSGKYPAINHGIAVGPFSSFSAAKKDAIDFHKSDRDMAAGEMNRIRKLTLKDLEREEGS